MPVVVTGDTFSPELAKILIGLAIADWGHYTGANSDSDKGKVVIGLVNAFGLSVVAAQPKSATDSNKFFTVADFMNADVPMDSLITYYGSYTLFLAEVTRVISASTAAGAELTTADTYVTNTTAAQSALNAQYNVAVLGAAASTAISQTDFATAIDIVPAEATTKSVSVLQDAYNLAVVEYEKDPTATKASTITTTQNALLVRQAALQKITTAKGVQDAVVVAANARKNAATAARDAASGAKTLAQTNAAKYDYTSTTYVYPSSVTLATVWGSISIEASPATLLVSTSSHLNRLVAVLDLAHASRTVAGVMATAATGGLGMNLLQIHTYAATNTPYNSKLLVSNSTLLTALLADMASASPTVTPTLAQLVAVGASLPQLLATNIITDLIIAQYGLTLVRAALPLSGASGYANFKRLITSGSEPITSASYAVNLNRVFITADTASLYTHLSTLYDEVRVNSVGFAGASLFPVIAVGDVTIALNKYLHSSSSTASLLSASEIKVLSIITKLLTLYLDSSLAAGSTDLKSVKSMAGLVDQSNVWAYIAATYGSSATLSSFALLTPASSVALVTAGKMTLSECVANLKVGSVPIFSAANYSSAGWSAYNLISNYPYADLVPINGFFGNLVATTAVNDSIDMEALIAAGLTYAAIKTEYDDLTTSNHADKTWLTKSNITFTHLQLVFPTLAPIVAMNNSHVAVFPHFTRAQKRGLFPNRSGVAGSGIRSADNAAVSREVLLSLSWPVADYIAAGFTCYELLSATEYYVKISSTYEVSGSLSQRTLYHTDASRIAVYDGYFPGSSLSSENKLIAIAAIVDDGQSA